jgi:hypothetical protein
MNPLPDRTVIVGLLATLGLVFAMVFWFVRISGTSEPALQWREPAPMAPQSQPALPGRTAADLI